jgi:hypothetical protein
MFLLHNVRCQNYSFNNQSLNGIIEPVFTIHPMLLIFSFYNNLKNRLTIHH